LHHPRLVKKLIVVDISLRRSPPSTEHQNLINAMRAVDFSRATSRSDVERQLQPLVKSEKLRLFLLKNVYWRDRDRLDWRLNLKAIDENLLTIFEGINETGSYRGPALFVKGALSPYVQEEDIPEIEKKFPGAVVKTISAAGHWVHADAPGEFLSIVLEFLNR
jgi:esterase